MHGQGTHTHLTWNITCLGTGTAQAVGWVLKNLAFGAKAFSLYPRDHSGHGNSMNSE